MRKDWEIKALGEVYDVRDGTHESPKYFKDGYPLITSKNLKNGELIFNDINYISEEDYTNINKRSKVNIGDILFAMIGTIGNPVVIRQEPKFAIKNVALFKVPKSQSSKFLKYYLDSPEVIEKMSKEAKGATQKFVGLGYLRNFPIALPSYDEQKHIVEILDEAFAAIYKAKANVEKNLKNANELFESYLHDVFAQKGEDWVQETLETLLEKGWITSHLDGNHGGGYPRKEEFTSSGIPYISANCIKGRTIDLSLSKYLTPERAQTIRKGIAINNDVLFAHNATVGPVVLLKINEPKVILGTSLTYYRCNPKFILPEYLSHYMRSKEFKKQYEIIMRQSTRNQVPITKQREFYHIIPPIEIQKELIKTLETLLEQSQKLEIYYKKKLEKIEELKKSILQKAFTGELTLTQNINCIINNEINFYQRTTSFKH